ncbi:MAG: polymerase, sigma-24 subunit, subfamily [Verrucomicrobia bacterium]|nr:polymerase, sigma-24 subunit, subfamily [Verrucomicrobiota bacterium]
MIDDAQLLQSYAHDRSEEAFAELVRRHLDFVYATALRQANGDAHLAQDATQRVFTDFARKASQLSERPVLVGWLYTSTRFAVAKLIRSEQRRRTHEQEAQLMMDEMPDGPTARLEWEQVRPVLDAALSELKEDDREAVLLRYFEGRDFAGVGAKLNLTENAARMRVDRALDKLHAQLMRRGVTSSTVALAAVLGNQAVVAAPAGLAASVTGTALASASAGIGALAAFMTMNKLTAGIAGALIVAGATGFVVQARSNTELRTQLRQLENENREIAALRSGNLQLAKTAAEVESMRADDTVLSQLNDEAESLKARAQASTKRSAQAAAAAATFEPAKLDLMPRVTTQVRPVYPSELSAAGVDGEVVVDFIVDSQGAVRNAYAAKSSQREFEASAIASVSQWKFEPGQKGGRMVNTHMQVPIVYKVATGEGAPGDMRAVAPPKKP